MAESRIGPELDVPSWETAVRGLDPRTCRFSIRSPYVRWQLPEAGHHHAPGHRQAHEECGWKHDVTPGIDAVSAKVDT